MRFGLLWAVAAALALAGACAPPKTPIELAAPQPVFAAEAAHMVPSPTIRPFDPDAPEAAPTTPVESGGALPPAQPNPNQGPSRRRR